MRYLYTRRLLYLKPYTFFICRLSAAGLRGLGLEMVEFATANSTISNPDSLFASRSIAKRLALQVLYGLKVALKISFKGTGKI